MADPLAAGAHKPCNSPPRCTSSSRDPLMSNTMNIQLDNEVNDRLDALADVTGRSKSLLVAEAIRTFVESNDWQIGEIQAALKEADAGDFVSEKDVAVLARKWEGYAR